MKNYVLTSVFLIFIFGSYNIKAGSIAGGDLKYESLGNNQYMITLDWIRDCSGSPAPMNVTLNVNSASCNVSFPSTMLPVPNFPGDILTNPCPTALTTCNGGSAFGAEIFEYSTVVTLPLNCPDWIFSVQDTSRADSLATIVPGQDFYIEAGLNNVGHDNSSVVCSNYGFIYSCSNRTTNYIHGALDIDGDSLVFYFVDLLSNGNTIVNYNSGFSGTNPLTSSPAATIDLQNGDIQFNCPINQFAVIGVRIDEYRNGNLIGYTIRNIAMYSDFCPSLHSPTLLTSPPQPIYIEAGVPFCFDFYCTDGPDDTVLMLSNVSSMNGATFSASGSPFPIGNFCWTPADSDTLAGPYTLTISLRDNQCPSNGISSYGFYFYVTPFTGVHEPDSEKPVYIFNDLILDKFFIHSSGPVEKIKVYNISGSILFEQKYISSFELNAPPGIYFVEIQTSNGTIVRKLIKF